MSAASLPLPTGAATEATLATRLSEATGATLLTEATGSTLGTEATLASADAALASIDGKIPASPSTDRTTAAAPFAVRISDGADFGTSGMILAGETGIVRITPVTSTGATPAELVAAVGGDIIYPSTISCTNESSTDDEFVEILSSTGPIVLLRWALPMKSTVFFDGRGDVRTDVSDALQFRLDDAGTSVKCSGAAFRR